MGATEDSMGATEERAALLAAVLAEPDDDGVRLVYSDWLEEHGETERAEFIRVQCRAEFLVSRGHADIPKAERNCAACSEVVALRRRERELLDAHGAAWFRHDRGTLPGEPIERNAWMYRPSRSMHPYCYWLGYARGFLGRFDGPAVDWLAHAGALLAAYPVREVWLTTTPTERQMADEYLKMDWHEGLHRIPRQSCRECLRDIWPGITFHLPAD